jgi:hypothetical protein
MKFRMLIDLERMNKLQMRLLFWRGKRGLEGGWKFRFVFCFMEKHMNRLTVKMKFGTVKDHGHTYKFLFESSFCLNMAMLRNF